MLTALFRAWNGRRVARCGARGIAVLALAAAIARLVSTYTVFSPVADEPYHIAAGMEWLDKGAYYYEFQHPPLARIAVALGPYLAGLRAQSREDPNEEGNAILMSRGNYAGNMRLARIGNLPFFVLVCAIVYAWGTRWFGRRTGVAALLLFSSLPPVLGHAALATTDMGVVAFVAAFLYQLMRWIEEPGWRQAVLLGMAAGGAFATKFSSFGFVPACAAAAGAYLFWAHGRGGGPVFRGVRWRHIAAACAVCFVILWAAYRFHLNPISRLHGTHPFIDAYISDSRLRDAAYAAVESPLPLAEVIYGFNELYNHEERGHNSYLMGEFRTTGWWYFFPLVIALKTPLGFLTLAVVGLAATLWRGRSQPWQQYLTALFPIVLLLVCMPSHINLGVRHALAIYPMLAIVAGHLVVRQYETGGFSRRLVVVALAAWTMASSAIAHPDYVAYFNEFASRNPEKIRTDSDLDWGQDWYRLSARLRALQVRSVWLGCFCSGELAAMDLPPFRALPPDAPVSGYVAISVQLLELEHAKSGAYGWLRNYQPLERVGKSIFLYYIPDGVP